MLQPLLDALVEGLRVVVLAIVPVLITSLEQGSVDWKVIGVAGALAFLRFVDKWLYLQGKESGNAVVEGGLTRF